MDFPKDFFWGTATAAYQIEGAANEDGRGLSVWDMFCRKGGNIWNGQSGETACDHYHRFKEDVGLMKELGVNAYRFSISWPRVLPDGTGKVNDKGLGFYDRLVDELQKAGIEPFITLFHWDFPYELYCRGGWLNPESPQWFEEYAGTVVRKLGDRARNWITLNEPQCFVIFGHKDNKAAPGDMLGINEIIRVKHNVLLSHGRAVQSRDRICPGRHSRDTRKQFSKRHTGGKRFHVQELKKRLLVQQLVDGPGLQGRLSRRLSRTVWENASIKMAERPGSHQPAS